MVSLIVRCCMSFAWDCLGPLASYLPYSTLTRVQECVIPTLLQSNDNVVVAAPTGSGKTALLEAAMLRLFSDRLIPESSDAARTVTANVAAASSSMKGVMKSEGMADRKAVYVCPIKALASEKYTLWREKFPTLSVVLETGDQEFLQAHGGGLLEVQKADIIITTPERWDSITRRWKEGVVWGLVASVALLLLDEVHTVSEERGAVLEAIVSRMKAIKASVNNRGSHSYSTRFVAISGTLPNIEDFAEWLQVPPSGVFSFTSADRPVPLTLRIISYPSTSNNPFAFDRFLTFKLFGLIRQFSEGKPSIVFCASRSEAINSALRIASDIKETASREGAKDRLQPSPDVDRLASTANDKQLRSLLLLGIAFHHAAMSMNDRVLVERMFREHYISVICTTTTLALGVNLPAHLVIIKGTTFFKSGRREDLPLSEVAQMSGRAGRPGLDSHGIALVLTMENKASLYESLRHGDSCTVVESRLHQKMVEHVNAEVALRTIHSFSLGVEWIKTTFLWIRLRHCPRHYGILFSTKEEELSFDREQFASELMRRMLLELEEQGCIIIRRDGVNIDNNESDGKKVCDLIDNPSCILESTRVGRSMARCYILLKTVELFNTETVQIRSKQNLISGDKKLKDVINTFNFSNILAILSRSTEFEDVHLRQGDRKHLNEINKTIRFPLNSGMRGGREVREDWHKVYVLIQAHLGHVTISDFSLRNDSVRLWTSAPRIARFLIDYAATLNSFSFIKESTLLQRCVEQRMWWDGPLLRQLDGIGENIVKSLLRGDIKNFDDILRADPRKLEALCGKNPPFGNELREKCLTIPQCELRLETSENSETVRVVITLTSSVLGKRDTQAVYRMVVMVGDITSDNVLLYRQFNSSDGQEKPLIFTFQVPHNFQGCIVGRVFTEHYLHGNNDATAKLTIGSSKGNDEKEEEEEKTKEVQKTSITNGVLSCKKKEKNTKELVNSSGAFDALCHDLRWVEGSSPNRDGNAPIVSFSESKKTPDRSITLLGCVENEMSILEDVNREESLSTDAGIVKNGGSPEAAASVHRQIPKDPMTEMDEDYKNLLKRTAEISSTLRCNLVSSAKNCKRPREDDSSISSTLSLQRSTSQYGERQEGSSVTLNSGSTVVLPRAISPDPEVFSCPGVDALRPSPRFLFGVQGAVPSRRVIHQTPYQFMGRGQVGLGNENDAVFHHYGGFTPMHFQPPEVSMCPPTFITPHNTYNGGGGGGGVRRSYPPALQLGGGFQYNSAANTRGGWYHGPDTAPRVPMAPMWHPEFTATVAAPAAQWPAARATRPFPTFNAPRPFSGAVQMHTAPPGASDATRVPTLESLYAVLNRNGGGAAPSVTAVRRGWW
ncbi:RNA helicase [Trypanosoma theileri]|uniref:DNA 3'-5' helicase n=1 Tax=Trypanosoma theileri TaxID=67003 RepID=A0A1X0NUQ2_9TRYP|nr:RNA helicase [Trypanosoma theileri]ORC88341.1 RNA helicase [Trypanosoma theileri]